MRILSPSLYIKTASYTLPRYNTVWKLILLMLVQVLSWIGFHLCVYPLARNWLDDTTCNEHRNNRCSWCFLFFLCFVFFCFLGFIVYAGPLRKLIKQKKQKKTPIILPHDVVPKKKTIIFSN